MTKEELETILDKYGWYKSVEVWKNHQDAVNLVIGNLMIQRKFINGENSEYHYLMLIADCYFDNNHLLLCTKEPFNDKYIEVDKRRKDMLFDLMEDMKNHGVNIEYHGICKEWWVADIVGVISHDKDLVTALLKAKEANWGNRGNK